MDFGSMSEPSLLLLTIENTTDHPTVMAATNNSVSLTVLHQTVTQAYLSLGFTQGYPPFDPLCRADQRDDSPVCPTSYGLGYHSPALHIAVAVLLGMLATAGTVGNSMVVAVVVRMAQLRRMTYVLVANLSAIGLLTSAVCIPTHLVHMLGGEKAFSWEQSGVLCKIRAIVNFSLVLATLINSAAMAVCRYKAVMSKHSTRLHVESKKNICKVLSILWLLPILIAITASPFVGYNSHIMNCFFKDVKISFWYTTASLSLPALASTLCMCVLYALILKTVRDSHVKVMGLQSKRHKGDKQEGGENRTGTGTGSYISEEKSQVSSTAEAEPSIMIVSSAVDMVTLPSTSLAPSIQASPAQKRHSIPWMNQAKHSSQHGNQPVPSTSSAPNPSSLMPSIIIQCGTPHDSNGAKKNPTNSTTGNVFQPQPSTSSVQNHSTLFTVDYSRPSTSHSHFSTSGDGVQLQSSTSLAYNHATLSVSDYPRPNTSNCGNSHSSNTEQLVRSQPSNSTKGNHSTVHVSDCSRPSTSHTHSDDILNSMGDNSKVTTNDAESVPVNNPILPSTLDPSSGKTLSSRKMTAGTLPSKASSPSAHLSVMTGICGSQSSREQMTPVMTTNADSNPAQLSVTTKTSEPKSSTEVVTTTADSSLTNPIANAVGLAREKSALSPSQVSQFNWMLAKPSEDSHNGNSKSQAKNLLDHILNPGANSQTKSSSASSDQTSNGHPNSETKNLSKTGQGSGVTDSANFKTKSLSSTGKPLKCAQARGTIPRNAPKQRQQKSNSLTVGIIPTVSVSASEPSPPTPGDSAEPVQPVSLQLLSPQTPTGIPHCMSYTSMDSSSVSVSTANADISEIRSHKSKKRRKKEVNLMFHLFLAFGVFCAMYLPFCFAHLVHAIHPLTDDTWLVLHALGLSFASNMWLVYAFLNKDFRHALRALLAGRRSF